MERYKNLSGDSGVTHYKIGKDFIEIKFKEEDDLYIYTDLKCGKEHIDKMKALALKGRGLSAYIAQHPEVKTNYTKR